MRPGLILAAALALFPAFATAAEDTIRFTVEGQTVVGTLSLPPGDPAPVVLLFHGFTGSRDELPVTGTDEGVFSRTARLLREEGIASLRIDFRDSGDSDGAFEFTTYERQVADGLAALDWLAAQPQVRGDRIALIGWSQGGLVATAVAGRSGTPVAVALWAAVADPVPTMTGALGTEVMAAGRVAEPDQAVPITLPWGAQIALRRGYFDGMANFSPTAEIAAYGGPLLVAQGSRDDLVPPVAAEMLIAAHSGPNSLWMQDMDHVFNVFTGPETLDAMVAETIRFFAPHLQ
jgi:uncharacterized protein